VTDAVVAAVLGAIAVALIVAAVAVYALGGRPPAAVAGTVLIIIVGLLAVAGVSFTRRKGDR
jgi:uncharacterized protein YacL